MVGSYESDLMNLSPRKWPDFLREHSGLPGPKANLELARAFAQAGTLMDFKHFIRMGADVAPQNTPNEFLTLCGVLGFGQYLSRHHDGGLLRHLRKRANDSRKRIRDGVVLALKMIGRKRISRLLQYAKYWAEGSYWEQRAVVAAVCEPHFLANDDISLEVLDLLDWVTVSMVKEDKESRGYDELREVLEECWSVAVVAKPERGRRMMERWMKEDHPIVNQIMLRNLTQDRIQQLDGDWVQKWRLRL